MPRAERGHLLILGGTAEALALARGCRARFGAMLALTSSLAGRTRRPVRPPGRLHLGGFGGAQPVLAIEVVFGATVVFLLLPLWIAIVHQATGILVFALLAAAYLRPHTETASPAHA